MKLVSKILSFLAISIIIAHAIIPHAHHSDVPEGEHAVVHQQAETIFDYVALAFHIEQQDGALEQFVQDNDNITFDNISIPHIAILYAVFAPSNKHQETTSHIVNNIPLRNNLFTDSFGLRGPPLKS